MGREEQKEESELHASMKRLEDARSASHGDEVEEVHVCIPMKSDG